jgi:penicillin-binding protein 1A
VNPWLITRITDQKGKVLVESQPPLANESLRAIDARNSFIMNRLLQEIARSGTAAKAQATLKRVDLYGKTGTTNDAIDTWFAGFHPTLTAVVWMGYDQPRSLGDRETGGGLSLPVWITFMETALKGVPVTEPVAPPGVVHVGGEWYYEEFSRGSGVTSLGVAAAASEPSAPAVFGSPAPAVPEDRSLMNSDGRPPRSAPTEDRRSILDLFRN